MEDKSDKMEYEDIYKYVGDLGKYQCYINRLEDLNLTENDIKTAGLPNEIKDGETVWSQCSMYDRNYTGWTRDDVMMDLYNNKSDLSVVPCRHGWVYDQSLYTSTIVTMWDLVCDKKWLQATASSVYMAGLMVGVFLFGNISDFLGRKKALCTSVGLTVIAGIACAFSPNYVWFVTLRFFLALATIASFTTGFVIIMELVGPSWRMQAAMVGMYLWAVSYMILAGIAYLIRDFFTLQLVLAFPTVIFLGYMCFLSESPRWLYVKGQTEKGERIIRKMAEVNKKLLPDNLDIVIKKDKHKATVVDLMRLPRMRWRSLNIFFIWFVSSLVYYGLSLNTSNLGGNPYINFCISGAVEIPAYIFCQVALKCLGRRWPLGGTMIVAGVALLLTLSVPKQFNVISIVLAMIGKLCISASFAIIYIFSAELFPTVVRNVGVGSGSVFARAGGVVAPFIGQLSDISLFIPMISFGVVSILAGLLALLLPETKDTSLPETIQDGEDFGRKINKTAGTEMKTESSAFSLQPEVDKPAVQ